MATGMIPGSGALVSSRVYNTIRKQVVYFLTVYYLFLVPVVHSNTATAANVDSLAYPVDYQKRMSSTGIRYIDYQSGDDSYAGSRARPWKHHPWDANASGKSASARGIHTYIFRRGVPYRGMLNATESGTQELPVLLTSEDGWGQGEAVLTGAEAYAGGWGRCSGSVVVRLPDVSKSKAWCRKTAGSRKPQALWETGPSGITRIPLARTPNWKDVDVDDPRSEWYELTDVVLELKATLDNANGFSIGDSLTIIRGHQSQVKPVKQNKQTLLEVSDIQKNKLGIRLHNGKRNLLSVGDSVTNGITTATIKHIGGTHSIERHLVDDMNLNTSRGDFFTGATVWAERRSMPKADAAIVTSYDPKEHSLKANFHRAAGGGPMPYDRYYLEGLPEFLDSAGEFAVIHENDSSGTLVLRLPDDRDPNTSVIEASARPLIVNISDQSHIRIADLTFRFGNQVVIGGRAARHAPLYATAIRIMGDSRNIEITDCNFDWLTAGIVAHPVDRPAASTLDNIRIQGNRFHNIGGSAIALGNGQGHFKLKSNGSRLIHVTVKDNIINRNGYRTLAHFGIGSHGDGIQIVGGEIVEVSGNQISRSWGSGISVTTGAEYDKGRVERPFLRSLIHGNTVIDSLLGAQDGGGINSWMGGPSYIYNNISGNPVGCMYSRYKTSTRKDWYRRGCYGVGIYLDGQYKGYVFNNIAWGKNNNANDRIYNSAGLNEAMGFMNTVFNNTFYRFSTGLHKGMFQHNRNYYLGNLFIDMGLSYIEQEPREDYIDYSTLAFSHNHFFGQTEWFGKLGPRKNSRHKDIESWRSAMQRAGLMDFDTGTAISGVPVRDAQGLDFRPTSDSPVIDKGVKVFVPWALYGVVGEWHFLRRNKNPSIINGENINMDSRWANRDMFDQIPRNDLQCVNTGIADFGDGILEDWIPGSLRFDGKTRFCTFTEVANGKGLPGNKEKDSLIGIGSSNFLIEAVVAPEAGSGPVGLANKLGDRGYSLQLNAAGFIELVLDYGSSSSQRTSSISVNDGHWHHILVEVDRSDHEGINIYVDGKLSNGDWSGSPMKTASLANTAEFIIGRSDAGFFKGKIDFLRLSRGTLAQAETNIEELYEWEFDGPYLYDYYGNINDVRDVGAVDYVPD